MKAFAELTRRGRTARLRQLAGLVLARYGLGTARISPLANHFNALFRVDDDAETRYVLRIGRPHGRTLEDVRSEVWWLDALRRETDLGVPTLVSTSDGGLVVTVEVSGVPEPRHCVLFRWMDGRDTYKRPTPRTVGQLGAVAAHLHDHADAWTPPAGFTRRRLDATWPFGPPADLAGDAASDLFTPERRAILRAAADRVTAALGDAYADPAALRFLHADLHLGNVKLHRGELRILDFDDSAWCPPAQDIGIAHFYLGLYPNEAELRDAFRAGYTGVRAWPTAADRIETFTAARHLELISFVAQADDPAIRAYLPGLLARAETRLRSWLGSR